MTSLLGKPPLNGKYHQATELRTFIKDKLQGKYPAVSKNKTMAVIVPYLVAVSEKVKGSVELKAAAQFVRHEMEGQIYIYI